jgi:hypothetical protein
LLISDADQDQNQTESTVEIDAVAVGVYAERILAMGLGDMEEHDAKNI